MPNPLRVGSSLKEIYMKKRMLFYMAIFVIAISGAAFTKAKAKKSADLTVYYQKDPTTCVQAQIQKDCTVDNLNNPCTWYFPFDGQKNVFHDATTIDCITPMYQPLP